MTLRALNFEPALAGPLARVPPLAQALVDAHANGLSLTEAFTGIVNELGFDTFTYGISTVGKPTRESRSYVWTNAPREWIAAYDQNGYIEVDPRLLDFDQPVPQFWDETLQVSAAQRLFLEAAAAYGIRSGVAMGLYLPSGTSVFWFNRVLPRWSAEAKQTAAKKLPAMSQLAYFAHDYLMADVLEKHLPSPLQGVPLSPREREVLQWIGRGKAAGAVGDLLGIAESTVQTYVRQILAKLGVTNRHEAVALGLKLGLIDR